ncbi:MAG: GTP cyclohydrolase II [Defluviimonas sp.]|uniref:GTP cyclohydrolase II n=1 Tax=Albidovulum sp. TaxID=1872424 RepID=UPI001D569D98|nr:GTP cyclohydrolase II [Paracoccaceae bacterium]MCC0062847.1 GTP cyclohydrolase II [Defluviimonas sp.]
MPLGPDMLERLNRARADLRAGVPVVLVCGGRAAIAAAAETLDAERLAAMRALGQPALAITEHRARTLKARAYDGDLARLELPAGAPLDWIRSVADPASDLEMPMKGPFTSLRDSVADAALARAAIALSKSARLLPATLVVPLGDDTSLIADEALTVLDWPQAEAALATAPLLHPVVAARVPMAAAGTGRLHVFRPEDGGEEHYAIEVGTPARDAPVLARLHSACFTGDVLGSLKCDCGPQLHAALAHMGAEGAGVLLYLNQEGRGIGLANKMRAYSLQDQGFDTVEANHRLGFQDDERDFRLGVWILKALGFSSVRLITNNPAKIRMMEATGIAVTERVALEVGRTKENAAYLAAKAAKSGHLL